MGEASDSTPGLLCQLAVENDQLLMAGGGGRGTSWSQDIKTRGRVSQLRCELRK